MNDLAIKIDHVYKEYQLGAIGGTTLKKEIQSKIARFRHKEDPNLKIGEKAYGKNERFFALSDVSLTVRKGETVGIIGQNGAGKSTLLKLICRVTAPTRGDIYMNGRLTSMLEVGTGFHNELTGRENVYLNGAILGMSKAEITEKFDEIVAFSEVGQFIDTPVKRYSSGMKVKLAFAVASHLDSEIMIMDEVLAVGDVNFQNKCIARMKKVASEEGRTILYVSHNMSTVRSLCDRCIVLDHGTVVFEGGVEDAIAVYMRNDMMDHTLFFDTSKLKRKPKYNLRHKLNSLEILDEKMAKFEYGYSFRFRLSWFSKNDTERIRVKLLIKAIDETPIGVIYCGDVHQQTGENTAEYLFDTSYLFPGKYLADVILYDEDELGGVMQYDRCTAMRFEIIQSLDALNLKHWFRNFGYTVLPCISNAEPTDSD